MLKPDYQALWDTMEIHQPELIKHHAALILEGKERYQRTAHSIGGEIPWYCVGIVHLMEGSLNFRTHLYNGDPLTARTVKFPPGRPVIGQPPFSWEVSAADSLGYKYWNLVPEWSITTILETLEDYNGLGYQRKDIYSPYLWSFTNHYTSGKYVEVLRDPKDKSKGYKSVFNPVVKSTQIGAAPLVRYLTDKTLGLV